MFTYSRDRQPPDHTDLECRGRRSMYMAMQRGKLNPALIALAANPTSTMQCPNCLCDLTTHLVPLLDPSALGCSMLPRQCQIQACSETNAHLSKRITQLEELLAQLRISQTKFRSFLQDNQVHFPPSRRLPPELLTEIFRHSVDADSLSGYAILGASQTAKAPLSISQVCPPKFCAIDRPY